MFIRFLDGYFYIVIPRMTTFFIPNWIRIDLLWNIGQIFPLFKEMLMCWIVIASTLVIKMPIRCPCNIILHYHYFRVFLMNLPLVLCLLHILVLLCWPLNFIIRNTWICYDLCLFVCTSMFEEILNSTWLVIVFALIKEFWLIIYFNWV